MLILNSFTTSNKPFARLTLHQYKYSADNFRFGEMMNIAEHFTNVNNLATAVSDGIVCLNPLTEELGNFVYEGEFNATPKTHLKLLEKLANSWFRHHLKSLNYDLNEQGMYFTNRYRYQNGVRVYSGFSGQVKILPDGNLWVTVDVKNRWVQLLGDYIRNYSNRSLLGLPVKLLSSSGRWISGRLIEKTSLEAGDQIPSKDESFIDFWNKGYRRKVITSWDCIPKPQDPIYSVKLTNGIELFYPISTVRVSIDISSMKSMPKEIISPSSRNIAIQNLAKETLSNISSIGGIKPLFDIKLVSNSQFDELGIVSGIFSRPKLEYGRKNARIPFKDSDIVSGIRTFGPYSGPKDLKIQYLCISDGSNTRINASKIHVPLNRLYENYKLGSLSMSSYDTILYSSQVQLRLDLISYVSEIKNDNTLVCVILNCKDSRNPYVLSKRIFGEFNMVSKHLTARTVTILSANNSKAKTSSATIVALQFYARMLKSGEAAVLLSNCSVGLPSNANPVILSLDISRDIERGEYGVAEITALTGKGLLITNSSKRRFEEKRFNEDMVLDWFQESIIKTTLKAKSLDIQPPNCFIFTFDGNMNSSQVKVLAKVGNKVLDQLIVSSILPHNAKFAMVEVTKNVPNRLFRYFNSSIALPEIGGYFIDPFDRAFLVGSRPYRGTSKLLRIAIRSQSDNFLSIKGLAHFIHDMRHLTPTSPWVQPRDPSMKYLAHNASNLARMGIETPYFPF